jgi:hypothetical protein
MGLDLLFGSFPQHAQVAQLVEHATENRSVGGSIPPLGTIFYAELRFGGRSLREKPDRGATLRIAVSAQDDGN